MDARQRTLKVGERNETHRGKRLGDERVHARRQVTRVEPEVFVHLRGESVSVRKRERARRRTEYPQFWMSDISGRSTAHRYLEYESHQLHAEESSCERRQA